MKIFLAILVTLAYAIGSTIVICKIRPSVEGYDHSWGYRQIDDLEATKRKKQCYLVDLGCLIASIILLYFLLDNWQTGATLLLIGMIFPAFAKSFPSGAVTIIWGLIAIFVIWQLPSTTVRDELPANEAVKIATVTNINGRVDSPVVEDHGQYLIYIDDGNSVKQERLSAELVNGHYIDDTATSIVLYHYSDFYKRSFWSKQRTKFVTRKLNSIDLYVKRSQLSNTF